MYFYLSKRTLRSGLTKNVKEHIFSFMKPNLMLAIAENLPVTCTFRHSVLLRHDVVSNGKVTVS